MNKITIILTASTLLVGCARTKPMTLGLDHPANPDAPVAPLPPPSTTLALSPTTTSTEDGHATTTAAARYVCPMHSEFVSDKPGKCPKCKMNLVMKKGAAR